MSESIERFPTQILRHDVLSTCDEKFVYFDEDANLVPPSDDVCPIKEIVKVDPENTNTASSGYCSLGATYQETTIDIHYEKQSVERSISPDQLDQTLLMVDDSPLPTKPEISLQKHALPTDCNNNYEEVFEPELKRQRTGSTDSDNPHVSSPESEETRPIPIIFASPRFQTDPITGLPIIGVPLEETATPEKLHLSRCISVPIDMAKKSSSDDSEESVGEGLDRVLPVSDCKDGYNCVSVDTVAQLVNGNFLRSNVNFLIADCRYPYEYNGGHIKNAVNVNTQSKLLREVFKHIPAKNPYQKGNPVILLNEQLEAMLAEINEALELPKVEYVPKAQPIENEYESDSSLDVESTGDLENTENSPVNLSEPYRGLNKTKMRRHKRRMDSEPSHVIIFHCEFSSHRAPAMLQFLRKLDRTVNMSRYPFLFFPELYVMTGGYMEFFSRYPGLCEPRSYVKMNARNYAADNMFYSQLRETIENFSGEAIKHTTLSNFEQPVEESDDKENDYSPPPALRKSKTVFAQTSNIFGGPSTLVDELPKPTTTSEQDRDGDFKSTDLRLFESVIRLGEHITTSFEQTKDKEPPTTPPAPKPTRRQWTTGSSMVLNALNFSSEPETPTKG